MLGRLLPVQSILAGFDGVALCFYWLSTWFCFGIRSTSNRLTEAKLATILSAAKQPSTLDEWLLSSPSSFARWTISYFLSSSLRFRIIFLDKSFCPPVLLHNRPHFLCKTSICDGKHFCFTNRRALFQCWNIDTSTCNSGFIFNFYQIWCHGQNEKPWAWPSSWIA